MLLFVGTLGAQDAVKAPAGKTDNCAGCHEAAWKDYTGSTHRKGGVSCEDCHGKGPGEFEGGDRTKRHAEGTTIPETKAAAAFCGNCHAAELDAFKKGPHWPEVKRGGMNGCSDCHVSHKTEHVPHAGMMEKCKSCHDPDSSPLRAGLRIRDRLAAVDDLLGGIRKRMERDRTYRWEFKEEEETLDGAAARYREALPLQHGVRPEILEAGMPKIETDAADAGRRADERFRAREGRRRWLWPVAGLTMLNALLAFVVYRRGRKA